VTGAYKKTTMEEQNLELYTKRLFLRPIKKSDLDCYQKYFCNYNVLRYLNSIIPWPYPENGCQDFYYNVIVPNQNKNRWFWAMTFKQRPEELIGTIELSRSENLNKSNRGFWLGEPFWGQGIMTEAVGAVQDFAFQELGFTRLILENAKGNLGSRRIKEKSGAVFLRTQPAKFVDPCFTESEVWELTKENWFQFRKTDLTA
jgi:RimJ/RimL family protein N-acetyltransferase